MTARPPHKKSQRHSTERRTVDPSPFSGETDAILSGQVANPEAEVEDMSSGKTSTRTRSTPPSGTSSLPSAQPNTHVSTHGKGKAPTKHDVDDGSPGSSKRKSDTPRGGTAEYENYVWAALAAKARHVQEKEAKASGKKPRDSPEQLLRPATSRLKIAHQPAPPTDPLQALPNHSRIQGLEGNPLYSSASRIEYPDGRVEYRVEFNVHRVQCSSCRTWFANVEAHEAHRNGSRRCPALEGE